MSQVWVLDDDKSIRWVFEKALAKANITFECFSNTNEAINKFNHEKPHHKRLLAISECPVNLALIF